MYTHCPQLFYPMCRNKTNRKGLLNSINTTCEGQVLAFLGFGVLNPWKSEYFCNLEPSVLFVTVSGREICNC